MPYNLSSLERAELARRASQGRSREARRARLILLLAQGMSWERIATTLRCSRGFIARWSRRFRDARLAGLIAHHHGGPTRVMTPQLERRIVDAASQDWTTRTLAAELNVSAMTIQRVWARHGLR